MSGSGVPWWRIVPALACGLAMFALAPILVRLAGPDADAVALTAVRTLGAMMVIVPIWWWHPAGRRSRPSSRPSAAFGQRHAGWLAGLLLALHFTLWTASLGYTSVASASVLVTCHPVLLIVIESLLFGARFGAVTWVGVGIAFAGAVGLAASAPGSGPGAPQPMLGNLLAFLAACLFVGYILIGRRVAGRHSWLDWVTRVYSATAVFTLALLLGLSMVGGRMPELSTGVIAAGLALALGAQLVGHGALNYAVRYVAPTLLSTLILAEPVFATLLAIAVFEEIPSTAAAGAMLIALFGIVLTWWSRREA